MTHTRIIPACSAAALLLAAGTFLGAFTLRSTAVPAVPVAPEPVRIALIDPFKVISSLEEFKLREESLKKLNETRESKLKEMLEQIKAIDAELKEIKGNTDADAKKRSEKYWQKEELSKLVQAKRKQYQELAAHEKGDVAADIFNRMQTSLETFAQREGYDAVFANDRIPKIPAQISLDECRAAIQSSRVLYVKGGVDVTDAIITIMNNEYAAGLNKPKN